MAQDLRSNLTVTGAEAKRIGRLVERTAFGLVCLVLCGLIVGVVLLARAFGHWNGRPTAITNGCSVALYVDDGRDGLTLNVSETLRWEGATKSGQKTIRVWPATALPSAGGSPGLVVNLKGDTKLAGEMCPPTAP